MMDIAKQAELKCRVGADGKSHAVVPRTNVLGPERDEECPDVLAGQELALPGSDAVAFLR
jgi:hypothetical protein